MRIRPIADEDVDAVVALWGACGLTRPWNAPYDDIALARETPQCEIFVGLDNDTIVASVLCGSDGHRGWIYYLAVNPDRQKDGLGREIMAHGEGWLRNLGVPKIELMIRPENDTVRQFYERIGYAVEDRIIMSRWVDGRKGS
jgi:ribosomal protein S18 acetylase RimI-like enzyme